MPIIALEQTGDAGAERGGDFSLFTRTADAELRERGLFIGESLKVIERAMAAGVPFGWGAGDTIYGVGEIELALRRAGKGYVLGVPARAMRKTG